MTTSAPVPDLRSRFGGQSVPAGVVALARARAELAHVPAVQVF